MTSALSITRAVNPPRAAFLDFPLGHTTGKADEPELQRAILRAGLEGFQSIGAPGGVKMLPFAWSDDDAWKDAAMRAPMLAASGSAAAVRDLRTERSEHGCPPWSRGSASFRTSA